jgi:quinol-cytochrome oxidoreductase complex cytochrome b subunit
MQLPIRFLRSIGVYYPTPSSLSGLWNFGVSAFVFLVVQILTGILLVTHYIPHITLAASSIEHLVRDVTNGWLLRYTHISGASFFFFMIYTHIGRGLHYASFSFPRNSTWLTGVVIFYLGMLIAFSGYILPWGQMSYRAATVITNLLTIFPNGSAIVTWVWGSPTISTATLSRFFTIHFISPFIVVLFVFLHIAFLHTYGSGNPVSRSSETFDTSFFSPYYITKDIVSLGILFVLFFISISFMPLALAHPDNYVPANPFVTPNHIVPEWYFLPAYAILRSCATKLEGILAFVSSILILLNLSILSQTFPFLQQLGYTTKTRKYIAAAILCSYLVLMYVGSCPVETPFIDLGEQATVVYFYLLTALYFVPILLDYILLAVLALLNQTRN